MRNVLLLIGLCLNVSLLQAQNWTLEALQSEVYQYQSLEEALEAPKDSVYSLKLKDRLKTVPPEVFQFTNLQLLDLSRNRLRTLPKEIGTLTNLKKLILERNKLEQLPAEIGMLEDLRELVINRNELETLPEEISNLKKLRYIDMWSNNITSLPRSMEEMHALEEVDLRVIVFTEREQDNIRAVLQNVKIHMDEHCNCGN